MYKKILPLVNRFVYLRQGYFNRFYEGKILEVTPDTLTLQAYDEQGKLDSQWVIALPTITEFMTGDRDLDELNMKVSMAKTIEQAELTELEQLSLGKLNAPHCEVPYHLSGLSSSLFSATTAFSEVACGVNHPVKKTPEASENVSKTPPLYNNLSEKLRLNATYLEETQGLQSPSSIASTPADDEHPQI